MTNDKGILIKNIFYMLAYAFRVLRQTNYDSVASEEFEDARDLFAAILVRGISQQLKQGLHREYIEISERLPVLRGRIDVPETMRDRLRRQRRLACEYDELSINNVHNQILKTTASMLLHAPEVKREHRGELRKILPYFADVDVLNPSEICWERLQFQRSNASYRMLVNVCRFALESLLQTTDAGAYRVAGFSEDNMARLYERFILEYYRRHFLDLHPRPAEVKWKLDGETDAASLRFLPSMQTDIFLTRGTKSVIIDAKYYAHTTQSQYDKETIHSANLYQIYAYTKNAAAQQAGQSVAGLLLYAKTEGSLLPDCDYLMDGNKIGVRTLDLGCDFRLIAKRLDAIAEEHFQPMPDMTSVVI